MKTEKMIWKYLICTFLLSYTVWGIVLLAQELSWFSYGTPVSLFLVIIGANSPAIITFFIFRKQKPGYKLSHYLKEAFALKQKPLFYLITLLFIAIFFGVPALLGGVAAQLQPFSGGTESGGALPLWITGPVIPFFFFLGGSEELGWRHYLQPELEKRMPFGWATITTAFIWDIWHLPLFFIIGTSQNSSDLLSFSIYIVGMSFALAAIHRISGSAWLCVFFHCATNALQGSWPLMDNYLIKGVSAVVFIVTAVIIVTVYNRREAAGVRAAVVMNDI